MGDHELATLREAITGPLAEYAELEDAVLTGYVILAEWSDSDGTRWITKTAGDINDDSPPVWTVKGWLYHALETAQRDVDQAEQDDD